MFETVNPIWKGNLGGNVFTKPLTKRASLDVWKCAFQGEVRYVKIGVVKNSNSFKKKWFFLHRGPRHLCQTLFCPFETKNSFLSEVVPNGQKHLGWPFWSLLDHFGTLTSLPFFGQKWTIFGPSPFMNSRPQSEKKAHHHVSYVWPACGTPSLPVWNINMVAIYERCQK